jgi:hypothetical protein
VTPAEPSRPIPQLSLRNPYDQATATIWIQFCADMIEIEPEVNRERLRAGVYALAEAANEQWDTVLSDDEGAQVHLHCSALGWDDALPEKVADIFTGLTGDLLFNAADGPFVTAQVLGAAIDKLADDLPKERNTDA